MKRLLWLGVGLAVGAIVVRKLNQKANEFTPTGIATSLSESAGGLVESLRSFVDDVRDGMAEREQQIAEAFAAGELYEDKFADLREDAGHGTQEGTR
ncbi:hypothetical protein [Actinoplanes sp. DH11]|uniref:hypothetical protein n=1 Tax=Actinoplanes sp. DH11 TaxID=2857011 RepID=UPI001E34F8D7|nr:hypothetical protein [Actinoplanes sp. DH11]